MWPWKVMGLEMNIFFLCAKNSPYGSESYPSSSFPASANQGINAVHGININQRASPYFCPTRDTKRRFTEASGRHHLRLPRHSGFLAGAKLSFHTFALRKEREIKVAIQGIPHHTCPDPAMQELSLIHILRRNKVSD